MFPDLQKEKRYLLACSFGPDSMALLAMLQNEGIHPIVCHVNYHHRPESDLEQSGLEQYCLEHNLELNILDTNGLQPTGNFQAWAREIRYRFFKDLAKEYAADALLVAHHQDDHLETFLMQKARKTRLLFYGLQQKTEIFGMVVLRPLLSFTKEFLKAYCVNNGIPFSIDSSNLTDHYQRNRVRHAIIEKLNQRERTEMLAQIQKLNMDNQSTLKRIEKSFPSLDQVLINDATLLTLDDFCILLYLMLKNKGLFLPLSFDRMQQVYDLCFAKRPNGIIFIGRKWAFERRYEYLLLSPITPSQSYCYVLNEPGPFSCPFFRVDFSSGFLKDYVTLDHYPLKLRPIKEKDAIKVGQHMKRINRLYIEWKMPLRLRKIWPIVLNKNDVPIYVPRYQKTHDFRAQSNFEINESFDYAS